MSNFNISKKKSSSEKHYRASLAKHHLKEFQKILEAWMLSIAFILISSIIGATFPNVVSYIDSTALDAIKTVIENIKASKIGLIFKKLLSITPLILFNIFYLSSMDVSLTSIIGWLIILVNIVISS